MDSFISRKRRRISPTPGNIHDISSLSEPDEDDSTDFKLAILSSVHPYIEQQVLLDILLAHDGSVEAASACFESPTSISPKKIPSGSTSYQSSLSSFAGPSTLNESKKPKLLSKKGKTLHLYSPEDVVAHTPCSIIHNFLPTKDANDLLEELLAESETFESMTFKLFDNVVTSPHTACFYVNSLEEQRRQKEEYIYNGGVLTDVRQITPHMSRISTLVQAAVNTSITSRIASHYPGGEKLLHQSPHAWIPNAAFANCYDGPNESVGYHSDQLTYLGPRAVIGSLSLGVAREFRVRRVVPVDDAKADSKASSDGDAAGQISIHLPHNSLLVMHAEMQEEWKHSIAPASSIDPHPISGKRRINITYRHYKETLHPKFTPRCKCGVPTVLRVVQRRKTNFGRYFWMCYAGNVPGKEGCDFFEWAEFDSDGEPVWGKRKTGVEVVGAKQLGNLQDKNAAI